VRTIALALAAGLVASPALAQDADRSVADGGIHVDGWKGKVDRRARSEGMSVADSRFVREGGDLRLSVGPAAVYWNPSNTASGDYEVSATFAEHAMQTGHPHPYGVFIGGSDLETDAEKLLYCIVYGDGDFVVKTFHGSNVTTVRDRGPHDAVNRAGSDGEATNRVGWRVRGDTASCVINGTVAASFDRSDVVGPDMLDSLDGIYGIRVSHNVELTVRDFGSTGG